MSTTHKIRRNARPGFCAACGERIEAGAGALVNERGRWKVYHMTDPCVPADLREAAQDEIARAERAKGLGDRVVVTEHEGLALFSIHPDVTLGYDRFDRYRSICRASGARWDRDAGGNTIEANEAPALIADLRGNGFAVDVAESLSQLTQDRAAAQEALLAEAREQADAIDAELARTGHALYPFQRIGVEWLASRRSGILGDDMGLGKTVQAIAATPAGSPVLVVCPAVARGVWKREFARFRPDFRVHVVKTGKQWRLPRKGEVVIVSYSLTPKCSWQSMGSYGYRPAYDESEAGGACPEGLVVIADEAHALKGKSTSTSPEGKGAVKQAARFRALAEAARKARGRTWLLTATPVLNRAPELRGILTQGDLFRESFGNYDHFMDVMGGSRGRYGMEWCAEDMDADAAREALSKVMLRRLKTEVLQDLPSKSYRTITVPLTAEARKACKALEDAMRSRGVDLNTALAEARDTEEHGADFEALSRARAALAAAKAKHLPAVLEPFTNAAEPVVVFSAHRAAIDALGDLPGWRVITGETPPHKRTEIEESFQRGELAGVAGTIKAAGVAITLTRASNAIFLDLDYTPALNSQAEDRIYRIGQENAVLITRLVADHAIDKRVLELLTEKSQVIASSVDAARRGAEERAVAEVVVIEAGQDAEVEGDSPEIAQSPDDAADRIARQALLSRLSARERDLLEEVERRDGRTFKSLDEWNEVREGEVARKRLERHKELLQPTEAQLAQADRRDAETPLERWAVRGLRTLTAADADHAQIKNDAGFNKPDTYWGHRLDTLAQTRGLTEEEWREVTVRLVKYQGQIGSMPREGV